MPYQSLEVNEWDTFDDGSTMSNKNDGADDFDDALTFRQPQEFEESDETPVQTPEPDNTRQTGDWACYKIYLRAFGWKLLTAVFGLKVLHVGLEVMPRKRPPSTEAPFYTAFIANQAAYPEVWLRMWTENTEQSREIHWPLGYVSFVSGSIILASVGMGYVRRFSQSVSKHGY